jgi:pimeloyl-ACP methyl ester carboxylesterase
MGQDVAHSKEARASANGIEIAYDTFGDPADSPMLLIMGLGAQMITWDEAFCAELARQGYYVIRFDNRDVGLSTKLDEAGVPNTLAILQAQVQGEPIQAPYTLHDMADDAAGLLDALEIEAAHVVGASMGGMIAQQLAIQHPGRVRTLTSIMSSTGNPQLPPPSPDALSILMTTPPPDRESYLAHALKTWRVLSGPGFPMDEDLITERAIQAIERGIHPAGTARQMAAILASGSRVEALGLVTAPTLVIHGDSDPLVRVEGGIETAESVPGAKLLILKGMGHDLPPALAPRIIEAIVGHAK